jgi:hypothetical protein
MPRGISQLYFFSAIEKIYCHDHIVFALAVRLWYRKSEREVFHV